MRKLVFSIALLSIGSLVSCNQPVKEKKEDLKETPQAVNKEVPFVIAKNYFVKNNYQGKDSTEVKKISSQAEFDVVFGAAALMGKEGKPTPIDFSKQHAIAVIHPVTDKATSLDAPTLSTNGTTLDFSYQLKVGEKQSYSIHPYLLLVVDNEYQGDIVTTVK
ncbi:hypothetical protein [Flavobacterium sp. '19STA2R22 D10 B1']|uniref:hypothetical protein n=1 Tax=Flavobacterium aerium TaxID=3037261 RepID=UPI00278C09A9|nr:hypothetical protein [Flavobacterium sp. '19STA2R22 D10 B1']